MPELHLKQAGVTSACCPFTKNPKYDVYQRGSASMVYKFFDKKSTRHLQC